MPGSTGLSSQIAQFLQKEKCSFPSWPRLDRQGLLGRHLEAGKKGLASSLGGHIHLIPVLIFSFFPRPFPLLVRCCWV